MLALCVGAAALIVPTPVSLPTTFVTAVGVIENTNIIKGDMYKGGTDSLDLSSMLDTIEDTKANVASELLPGKPEHERPHASLLDPETDAKLKRRKLTDLGVGAQGDGAPRLQLNVTSMDARRVPPGLISKLDAIEKLIEEQPWFVRNGQKFDAYFKSRAYIVYVYPSHLTRKYRRP